MPIHDWTRVDANLFHHFHQAWSLSVCKGLNTGLLPPGFSALVEQRAAGVEPDVIALERRMGRPGPILPVGGAVMTDEPVTRHVMRARRRLSVARSAAARANRVVVRHSLGRVVCVIEIVSPGNKGSGSALGQFVRKTVDLLNASVNVLVVDLFPPSKRDPHGIHKVIWDRFERSAFSLPADKPLTLASYVSDIPARAYVECVAVGDALPDMPAFLDGDSYVPVPLMQTYDAAWEDCPEVLREAVENRLPRGDG